ncbi:MAG: cytochrome bc complex cytochrome b subunit [Haloarculaceae archaeon]
MASDTQSKPTTGPDAEPDHPDVEGALPVETRDPFPNSRLFRWLDARFDLDRGVFGKAFPEDRYGSFLLGEVALFSFILLVATGTFLGLLYSPSAGDTTYEGAVAAYAGQTVPSSFASVLTITYDTPFGMFVRMAHHWAAYIFIASIALHMFRVFFSGSYRNPHEPNWFVGGTLLLLSLVEGFFGYALPFDNFSKTATGIGFEMAGSVPVLGSWLQGLVFGGAFPDDAAVAIPRMFFLHVFLVPAAIAVLVAIHMGILITQKHSEHAPKSRSDESGPAPDDDSVVVGLPLFPQQALLSTIVFLLTATAITLLAGFFPVQRVAVVGPASATSTPPGVTPDWFFMWVFGALKLLPGRLLGGIVLPLLIIGLMIVWPLIDNADHPVHFTVDPLDRPVQTGLGVGAITLIIMLSIAGMKSTVAEELGVASATLDPILLALTAIVPIGVFAIIYWMLSLRRRRLAA